MRKHHRVRVGLFVVISVVTLGAVLLWISGSRLLRPVTHYDVLFESSVTGLLPGSRVEYQGVVVGKVSSIRLTREPPPRGLITLELRGGTPVREDTYATLIGSMVTNIRYVELRGGSKDSPELPPGSVIRAKEGGINDIQDKASELSERVLSIVDQVQTRVLTPENIAAAGVLLKDIAGSAANLLPFVPIYFVLARWLPTRARSRSIHALRPLPHERRECVTHAGGDFRERDAAIVDDDERIGAAGNAEPPLPVILVRP